MAAHFAPGFFAFLRDLKRHNDRTWFADNRERYVRDVEAPMLQFIADVAPRLARISRAFVADRRRVGGSMFRIHRDTRFSADKSPFKTWIAARFPHEARKTRDSVPGFYVHLEPKECYGGGGVYHSDQATLTHIRRHIVEAPRAWAAVLKSGIEIEGEQLKRAPSGFDPAHRYIEDLKRKDLYSLAEFTPDQVLAADFLDRYMDALERVAPLQEFLTKALGLRW
jgi:uncharacterized protein (TIGR02453 family)